MVSNRYTCYLLTGRIYGGKEEEKMTGSLFFQMLVVFKSAPILKRALKVKQAMMQLYVLKLLKMQASSVHLLCIY